MDYKTKLEELKKNRDNIMSQLAPALQQLGFLDGQIAVFEELIKESEPKKEEK